MPSFQIGKCQITVLPGIPRYLQAVVVVQSDDARHFHLSSSVLLCLCVGHDSDLSLSMRSFVVLYSTVGCRFSTIELRTYRSSRKSPGLLVESKALLRQVRRTLLRFSELRVESPRKLSSFGNTTCGLT